MEFREIIDCIVSKKPPLTVNNIKMYINGEWVEGEGKEGSLIINPATEKPLATVFDASHWQIHEAFVAARKAQEYWYLEIGQQQKENIFRRVEDYLQKFRGEIAWFIINEIGKRWKWADAEVQETIDTVRYYFGEIGRVRGEFSQCQMADKFSITVRKPYGTILGITAFNFPLAVPSWKIFPALVGGNAIIIKSSEQAPTAISVLCYLVHQAIKDELGEAQAKKVVGIFQLIHGKGETVGQHALMHGDYDKVMFTGGAETGSKIGAIVGKRIKPMSLELGGHPAVILMDDFDIDLAVSEVVNAWCGDSGTRCVSERALFLPEAMLDNFLARLVERAHSLRIGNPADFETDMGPLASEAQVKKVNLDVYKALGRLVCGGLSFKGGERSRISKDYFDKFNKSDEVFTRGYYYPPTVLVVDDINNYAMQNEIFGPVLTVMPVSGFSREEIFLKAIDLVNASSYGLSNALLTRDMRLAMLAIQRLKTGIGYIGRGTTGAEVGKHFGGIKNSGFGRECYGVEEVTYIEQVYIDFHGKLRMAQAGEDDIVKENLNNSKTAAQTAYKN